MSGEQTVVFGPKRGKRWWYAIGLLVVAGLIAAAEWHKPLLTTGPADGPPAGNLMVDFSGGFCGLLGLGLLLAILKGVPKLTLNRQGLVLQTVFGTRTAQWTQLGAFAVIIANKGRRTEKPLRAVASMVPAPGRSRWARRGLSIPDGFEVPLATILREIAARHVGLATGGAPVIEQPTRPVGVPGFRFPWLTAALLASFVAVFVLEQRLAVTPAVAILTPSVNTLNALGGLSWNLVQSGQWFRLFAAPFLHAGVAHLLANAVAFGLAGYGLERTLGRAWMFCIFAAGALAGSAMSMAWAAPATISVGASGAIMAMLAALFLISFRLSAGRLKTQVQIQSARVAIPALIPVSSGAAALHVDYGAHFGGALIGVALGLLLLRTWHDASPLPRFRTAAMAFAALAAVAFAASGVAVAQWYPSYAAAFAETIPVAELQRGPAAMIAEADSLVAAYPRDPRSHFFAAYARLARNDKAGAEQAFRTGLSLARTNALAVQIPPVTINNMRGMLAHTVFEEGRKLEAILLARDACQATGDASPALKIATALRRDELCVAAVP